MSEGTIFSVLVFPKPWPPQGERELFSGKVEGVDASIAADPAGCLLLTVHEEGQALGVFRFQPLTVKGSGRALMTLTWSGADASLRLNGQEVLLEDNAVGRSFLLKTPDDTPPKGPLFPSLDPAVAKSDVEYLLLSTLADIDQKLLGRTRYSLIRAAGLLRQLLLDDTPLVHQVNRPYRRKIQFEVVDHRTPPPVIPQAHWLNPDASSFPRAQTINLNLDGLLSMPYLILEGTTATVRDLIKACANVKGGVHLGIVRTSEEGAIIDFDRAFRLVGEEPSLFAIAGVCRVVLRGLAPLVRAIHGAA